MSIMGFPNQPFHFEKVLNELWPEILTWDVENFLSELKFPMTIRTGQKQSIFSQKESEVSTVASVTKTEFLRRFHSKICLHEWFYIDYKNAESVFTKDITDLLDWYKLNLPEAANYKDAAFWLGTAGAHTPCHFDTYGFNVVVQLKGHKRWKLFYPGHELTPTRLPFEETTVYSQVDVRRPCGKCFPSSKGLKMIVVDMREGDVLYVPKHWWHFVECIETAVNVNLWCPLPSDKIDQQKEALTKLLLRKFTLGSEESNLIHSSEIESFASNEQEEIELNFLSKSKKNLDPKTLQEEDAIVYKDFIEFLKRNLETNPNCKRLEPNIELKTSTDCCCLNDQLDKNPWKNVINSVLQNNVLEAALKNLVEIS
ncbi:HSPB1-associated protein 1 homolog [Symsagittifera roscoffensis]|uniref:HSPB1-associated protein 1 homolog n=1 Tax=Symsagittifera roscoffensis TaxID=84072 RepID=UPI00307BB2AE